MLRLTLGTIESAKTIIARDIPTARFGKYWRSVTRGFPVIESRSCSVFRRRQFETMQAVDCVRTWSITGGGLKRIQKSSIDKA